MRIYVTFTNKDKTSATVTFVPNVIARFFGAKKQSGEVFKNKEEELDYTHKDYGSRSQWIYFWYWKMTHRRVDRRVLHAIELQAVEDLPPARILHGNSVWPL